MQERSLPTLIALGRSVLAESDLETVLDRVLDAAQELTGARYAALGVLDGDRRKLERFVTAGIDDETRRALGDPPRGHGVLGILSSFLGVPILIGDEAWGNLYLTEKRDGELTEDDEQAVVMLAQWAAIAIENARRPGAMSATVEISRALAGETDLDRILQLIATRGRALVGARVLVIELAQGDRVRVAAAAGEIDARIVGEELDARGSLAELVLDSRRPQRLSDAGNRERFEKVGLGSRFGARAGLLVPLAFRAEAPGVLVALDPLHGGEFTDDDERLLTSFAVSAASAVVTARSLTLDQLRAREAATEDERRRWARELHDETLQGLGALRLALSTARRLDDPRAALTDAIAELDNEIASLRGIISDVRPASLDELGTQAALEALADRTRSRGVEVHLDVDLDFEAGRAPSRHDPELETAVYRIVQEAVTNAVKHAGAEDVAVAVREVDGAITVRVHDEGRGFDPAEPAHGYGLVGVRERVESLGGSLAIVSAPRAGTTLTVRLPTNSRRDDRATPRPG